MEILLNILMFLGGAGLLVYSVEKFIGNLVKTATVYGVSAFFLAVIFAGMDFENWAFGISGVLKGAPDIALGSAVGSAMFLMGAAVVIGGILTPFRTETPREYLLLMVLSPLILLPFLIGGLTRIDGVILILIFGSILLYIQRRESKGKRAYLRDEEVEEAREELEETPGKKRWIYPLLMIIFVGGIVLGAEISVRGAKDLVQSANLSGTIFGMTIAGLVMSIEEILLVVEPVRKGEEKVAVGNIVGSLIFFSTGNVGLLAAAKGFQVEPAVLSFYWPFLFFTILLVGSFLARGKIQRKEASVLGVVYVIYWILSYTFLH